MRNDYITFRQIRIFISSTFRDMHSERDYLVNKVFPLLKKYCQDKDVTLTELDLRWGISEDESEQSRVLEACLQEIDNSYPFFIGILGNRYGWVPDKKEMYVKTNVLNTYPWVENDLKAGLSITEIEMQYAALRANEPINAYFYIRSPDITIPEDHCEEPGSDTYLKLQRLKQEIRTQTKYPVEDYSTLEELGKLIERNFKILVDRLFPQFALSEVEKERLQHRAFLLSRTQIYIGEQYYFDRLNEFIEDNSQMLVVTGDSGMGKSALIANWIKQNAHTFDCKLIYHSVGNSSLEGDYLKITKRLINELSDLYGVMKDQDNLSFTENIDRNSELLKEELQKLLAATYDKGKLLLILDGVNQLVTNDNAKLLNWLPVFPLHIKVIFTTLVGDQTMGVFERRGYPKLVVHPLSSYNRKQLIINYLKNYGKTSLNVDQIESIATDPKCENTLVLRTLLNELRIYGKYNEIDNYINSYLGVKSISDFFDLVLQRYEKEYKYKGRNIVREFLSMIAVSRSGLSETELLEITGIPTLYWVQFFHAFSMHLVVKNGLITFSHQFIYKTVLMRYESDSQMFSIFLLDYFCVLDKTKRKYDELVYQLLRLERHDDLFNLVCDLEITNYIGYWELFICWRFLLDTDSSKYSLNCYTELNVDTLNNRDLCHLYNKLGYFMSDFLAAYKMALVYFEKSLIIQTTVLDEYHSDTATLYHNIGITHFKLGNCEKAFNYHKKALNIRITIHGKNHPETAISYRSIGDTLNKLGDNNKSLTFCRKALNTHIATLGESHQETAISHSIKANVYRSLRDYEKALYHTRKALNIRLAVLCEDHPNTASAYNNIGVINYTLGDYKNALTYFDKALDIDTHILGENHPSMATSFNNIGFVYYSLENYEKALTYFEKSLNMRIAFWGENHLDTAKSYNSIADVYYDLKDFEKALTYYEKETNIYISILGENYSETGNLYYNKSLVYSVLNDFLKSLEIIEKIYSIKMEELEIKYPKILKYIEIMKLIKKC